MHDITQLLLNHSFFVQVIPIIQIIRSFRIGRDETTGDLYIADGFRERLEYPDQNRFIIARVTAERDTEHDIEKALHGEALIQGLRREAQVVGTALRGIRVTADKITRALTWAPLA